MSDQPGSYQSKEDDEWGVVEQNAYGRLLEGDVETVPAQELLDWLSELEQEQVPKQE